MIGRGLDTIDHFSKEHRFEILYIYTHNISSSTATSPINYHPLLLDSIGTVPLIFGTAHLSILPPRLPIQTATKCPPQPK